ncbi:MAG TPA: respiratory nitrate reductase subunit gamma [Nitrososphaerales archaeon]|nr:respiratory nitrate reductase subunit gamma [Nitrososphaerales archaeon]
MVVGVLLRYNKWRKAAPPRFFKSATKALGSTKLVKTFFSELINRVLLQRDVIHKDKLRWFTHLAMFWGFVGLSLTTTLDAIYNRPGNYIPLAGSLSFIRWIGNFSGALMVLGATIAIGWLILVPKFRNQRTFGDVWFTVLLFLAGVTGFATEYYGEVAHGLNPTAPPAASYSISLSASLFIVIPYGVHLASIGLLLITAPFSAFIHAFSVPSMRYVDRVGALLSMKAGKKVNETRRLKEDALMEEMSRKTGDEESAHH